VRLAGFSSMVIVGSGLDEAFVPRDLCSCNQIPIGSTSSREISSFFLS
jgi:hypothetical protein